MSFEAQSTENLKNFQEKENQNDALKITIHSFSKSLHGTDRLPEVSKSDNDISLKKKETDLKRDGRYDSSTEFYLVGKIIGQRDSIEFENKLNNNKNLSTNDSAEYLAAHETLSYNEYFLGLLNAIEQNLKLYDLERTEKDMPTRFNQLEIQAEIYLNFLREALEEQREYASARLSDFMIRSAIGKPDELRKNIREFSQKLKPESLSAFRKGGKEGLEYNNKLDQNIIDILAGKADIPGVEKGFNPTHLYFDILKYKYEKLLAKQRQDARTGEGTKFSKDSPEGKERDRLTAELVKVTQQMGIADIQLAELATLNNLLGKHFNLSGALEPRTTQTPREVSIAIQKAMKQRSDYHLGQMEQFSTVVDTVVLSEGVRLNLDDFWTKNGRNGVKFISEKVASAVSLVVPKTAGMRQWAYDELTDPISDAMGWPKGKEKWEELTPDEQANVRDKSKSILDCVRSFDRTTIANFTGTIALIRSMPDPATLIDQANQVPNPLPTDDLRTPAQLNAARSKYGDATAYCMLFTQLERDWGDSKEGTGLMGQYAHFFDNLEKVIGVKLDVARGDLEVANKWGGISISFGILALLGLVAGALITKKLLEGTIKLTAKITKETVRAGAKGTRAGLDALRTSIERTPKAAPTAGAAPAADAAADLETMISQTAPKATGKFAKGLRMLSNAGFVLAAGITAKEIYDRIDEQAQLAPITDEKERIQAALHFFESQEAKRTLDSNSPAYHRSINLLTDRLQSVIALRETAKILPNIPTTGLDDTQKSTLIRLQTRAWALQKNLQESATKVHDYTAKHMPIDSLMSKDARSGQYKVDVGGGVGIFSGGKLQDAMQQSDPKLPSNISMADELAISVLRQQLAAQTDEYTKALHDYAEALASTIKQ